MARNPLISVGYVFLGVGFLYEIFRKDGDDAPAKTAIADPPLPAGKVIKKVTTIPVRNIDERVNLIAELVRKGSLSPRVKEIAISTLTVKCGGQWCIREKDYPAEIKALFKAVKDPKSPYAVRYTRDHVTVDQFTSAERTLDLHAEDCDGLTIMLGSLLRSVGYPLKLRVIQAKPATSWSHIYLLAGIPPMHPDKWISLDLSVAQPPGWEAPGAKEVARSGRPSGVVVKLRDFDV